MGTPVVGISSDIGVAGVSGSNTAGHGDRDPQGGAGVRGFSTGGDGSLEAHLCAWTVPIGT